MCGCAPSTSMSGRNNDFLSQVYLLNNKNNDNHIQCNYIELNINYSDISMTYIY